MGGPVPGGSRSGVRGGLPAVAQAGEVVHGLPQPVPGPARVEADRRERRDEDVLQQEPRLEPRDVLVGPGPSRAGGGRYGGNGSSLLVPSRYRLCLSAWEGDGMTELPRSLPEFEARFPDEAACARWLLEKRWPDGFRCPACGHDRAWELGRERLTLQCAACERQVSVTAG